MQFNGILEPYGLFAPFLNDSLSGFFHLRSSIYLHVLLVLPCRSIVSLLHIATPWRHIPAEVYSNLPLYTPGIQAPNYLAGLDVLIRRWIASFACPHLPLFRLAAKYTRHHLLSHSQLLISHTVIFYSCCHNSFLATRSPIPFRLI